MNSVTDQGVSIFPLNTVLYPDGVLPLKPSCVLVAVLLLTIQYGIPTKSGSVGVATCQPFFSMYKMPEINAAQRCTFKRSTILFSLPAFMLTSRWSMPQFQ